jgi:hypothetical protein
MGFMCVVGCLWLQESAHGTAANQMLLSKGMIPAPGVLSMQPQAAGFVVAASINEHVAGVGSDTAHQTADLAGAAGVEDAALLVAASTAPADAAAVVIIGAQKQERKADAQRDSGPPADVINIPADGSGHPHTSGTSVSEVAPLMPQQHHGRTGGSIGTPVSGGLTYVIHSSWWPSNQCMTAIAMCGMHLKQSDA